MQIQEDSLAKYEAQSDENFGNVMSLSVAEEFADLIARVSEFSVSIEREAIARYLDANDAKVFADDVRARGYGKTPEAREAHDKAVREAAAKKVAQMRADAELHLADDETHPEHGDLDTCDDNGCEKCPVEAR